FSSRRRHTRCLSDWSSDVCSSDLAEVRAWDPVARPGDLIKGAVICKTALEAVTGADAAVIVTEWPELKGLTGVEYRDAMARPLRSEERRVGKEGTSRGGREQWRGE